MKKSTVFLAVVGAWLLTAQTFTYGQNSVADSTATIISHWKKGEVINLALLKQRNKLKGSQLLFNEGSTYEATITILDSSQEGYTLEWIYRNFKLKNPHAHPIVEGMTKLSEGMKVKYTTNQLGAFTSLLNWQEIQEIGLKKIDGIFGAIKDPQVMAVASQAKSMFNSKSSIELLAIKEVRLYHSLYGKEQYELNEVLKIATQVPNILGGDPLPALLTIEMTALKPEENYCKIQTLKTLDEEKTSKIIFAYLTKTAKATGATAPTEKDLPLIKISEKNEFEVDLKSGWLTRIRNENEVQSADMKQLDLCEIKLQK